MNCGVSLGCAASVFGRSSLRLDVISGAVIMKMTSSTSMTSISGVMLMSLIGCAPGLRSRRPKAICASAAGAAVDDHLSQVVGEAFELGLARGDALAEDVVGEHGGNRDREAGGGHHERLPDRTGDALDRDRPRRRDADERVVDPPDGAEEADEGSRAADRGEQDLAELELTEHAVQRLAQAARQLRIGVAVRLERAR